MSFYKKELHQVWLVFLLAALLLVWIPSGLAYWLTSYAYSPEQGTGGSISQVYIPPKTSFLQIKKILADAKVIKDDVRFTLLARVMGVAHRLKAGEYLFDVNQSPYEILVVLEKGKAYHRVFTLIEGTNIFQAAEQIGTVGWGDKEEFLALASDQNFIKGLGLDVDSLEGYLFPDTYYFQKGVTSEEILVTMVERLREVLVEECSKASAVSNYEINCSLENVNQVETIKNGKKIRLNSHHILTLASIVEKETGCDIERPMVAEVFLNRLKKGMRLQADPTVTYGLQKFGKPLSKKDLKSPTPYNTYTKGGLPKGPICNPGRASIAAVVTPAKKNYYYFVSENDGSHFFSKTLKEHNRAVARFRAKKKP